MAEKKNQKSLKYKNKKRNVMKTRDKENEIEIDRQIMNRKKKQ